MDPWGAPAAATVGSAGPSPPPTVPVPAASGPWGPAPADPWGVASPASPTTSDPWGGGAPPNIAPPPDPWGETSNRVNNVDPWGSSGKRLKHWSPINSAVHHVGENVLTSQYLKNTTWCLALWMKKDLKTSSFTLLHSTFPFPVFIRALLHLLSCHFVVVSSHPLTCFQFVMMKASMLNPFALCLKGFLSSCFCSGLTVAVSQPELSLLLPVCVFLMYKVAFYYLSFTSTELQILIW